MEIERKFLLKSLPDIPCDAMVETEGVYISITPEVRVRRTHHLEGEKKGQTNFKITVKGDGDLSREEMETAVSEEFYNEVVRFIGKRPIRKDYRRYNYEGHTLECSVVDAGTEHEFIYGEVEFETEEEAKAFVWPFEGAVDVTYDRRYKMKNYWAETRK